MASILCLPAWSGTYTTITYTDPMELKIGSPCFVEVAGLDSHVYASDIQYSTALNQHVISINFDTPPTQPQMQYPFEADKRWLLFLGSFLRLHSSRTLPY